ncbi:MAG: GNAT family N-acetyltransferase [Pseudomonadota bacterium]
MSASLIVRDAVRSEFSALADLQIRSWRSVYHGIMEDDYLDNEIDDDLHKRWRNLQPSGDDLVLVADRNGIAGFITVWCKPDPYIDNLHVEPSIRSQGIGRELMLAAAERLLQKGYRYMFLYVAADNHRAADFYRRLGGLIGDVEHVDQAHGGTVAAMRVIFNDLTALTQTAQAD